MKKFFSTILLGFLCLNFNVHAQPTAPGGSNFDAATSKLFGDNQTFSATMELQTTDTRKKATRSQCPAKSLLIPASRASKWT